MYISENIFDVVILIFAAILLLAVMFFVNDLVIDINAHSKIKAKLFFALTVVNGIVFSLSYIGMFLFPVKKGLVSVPEIGLVISFLCYAVAFAIHLLKNRP